MSRRASFLTTSALSVLFACNTAVLTHPPDSGPDPLPDVDVPDSSAWPFPTTSNVSIVVEPSDNAAALLAAINGAQKSVHVTMYLLSNNSFTNALINRKKAGVDVQVVLNQTFPDPSFDNTPAFNALKNNGVPVVWASKAYTFTHEKCVIVDGATAWIMTMNLTVSSPSQNREFLAVDSEPADVAEAETIFAADFANQVPAPAGRLVLAPKNARDRIGTLIGLAKSTIDVESETFSDLAFQNALQSAKVRGVTVRVLVSDQNPTTAMSAAINALKNTGISVKKLATPYIHSKAIVVDGVVGYVGSANLTQNSVDGNRELGLIVEGAPLQTLAQTIDADFKAGVAY